MIRDAAAKAKLLKYMEENPEQRLFQSIRNIQQYNFIYASNKMVEDPDIHDTWEWEGKVVNGESKDDAPIGGDDARPAST